jgi:hypothetical protein
VGYRSTFPASFCDCSNPTGPIYYGSIPSKSPNGLNRLCPPIFPTEVRTEPPLLSGFPSPSGVKGENIPSAARIMSVAGHYDALRSARAYELPLQARKRLRTSGKRLGRGLIRLSSMLCSFTSNNSNTYTSNTPDGQALRETPRIPLAPRMAGIIGRCASGPSVVIQN